MQHSVSVIIPAWNAEKTISECLGSIGNQTEDPLEVVLVDDGSDDRTAVIAGTFGATILSTGGRKGPAAARNVGAKAASGDILVFLDADVTVPENLIGKITGHFKDSSTWAVQTLYSPLCPAEDDVSRYQNYYYYHNLKRVPGNGNATFATYCSAVLRNRFLEIGGFNVRIPEPTVEDEEFGYTIADSGGRIILDKTILVTHLAVYTLSQFTTRRIRMARAQAKSGWRQVKRVLLGRYMNVRKAGTHHSRWVVLSILLVLLAQLSLIVSTFTLSIAPAASVPLLLLLSIGCHGRFLHEAAKDLGRRVILPFALLSVLDMAVLGWGIVLGSIQFVRGKKY